VYSFAVSPSQVLELVSGFRHQCLSLFQGEPSEKLGAVGAVLVKPDDSVGAHSVSLSHCCLIIAGQFLAVKNYFDFSFLLLQRVSLRVVPWRSAEEHVPKVGRYEQLKRSLNR
jgi:hypothetical protein